MATCADTYEEALALYLIFDIKAALGKFEITQRST